MHYHSSCCPILSHLQFVILLPTSSRNDSLPDSELSHPATMGTLTADLPRLPEYCDHKLPTSCRLSSIPNCCACADERAHQSSYSTYVDGVGFVARGARWDRYCWPCSRTTHAFQSQVTPLTTFRVLEKQSRSNKPAAHPNSHPSGSRSI